MDIKKRFEKRGRSYAQMIKDQEGKTPPDDTCGGCGQRIPEEFCISTFQYDGDYYHPKCLVPTLKRDLAESDALFQVGKHLCDECHRPIDGPVCCSDCVLKSLPEFLREAHMTEKKYE